MKAILAAALALPTANILCTEVRLHVVNDLRAPIVGAKTLISFTTPVHGGATRYEGSTDDHGLFSGSGRAVGSVFVLSEKDGHYGARFERLPNNRDLDVTVVLPRIIDPIPLFARSASASKLSVSGRHPDAQFEELTIGFDLMKGEMVAPFVKGVVPDLLFKIRNRFVGWRYSEREMEETRRHPSSRNSTESDLKHYHGKFEAELEISFPGANEGLVEVKDQFLPYSRLKMPHRAPEAGYVSMWRAAARTYSGVAPREDVGFFLRTRVKLDKEGRIVSANYAKVVGDFQLDPRGFVNFTYYFNPTPNDRNLEFDPKRNLFPSTVSGSDVRNP
jgi:hypothetical protein